MGDTASIVSAGATIVGGISQKNAANRAAARAQEAANFNADIIERDIDLLTKQREIINANYLVDQQRARRFFEEDVQGAARAGFGFAGIDMSHGTPMQILRENAREFDYQTAVAEFDNEIANMQISDAQEEARLNAELARMEGGSAAASLRSQGTQSLLKSFTAAGTTAIDRGLFD